MTDRFYAPVSFDASVLELSPDESRHLAGVLRKSVGDPIVVFDGRGVSAEAVVETVGKRVCTVRIVQRLSSSSPPRPPIELASAVPKGDRARWLVEKATELGADRWTPLRVNRSVVEPRDSKLKRLRQTVIAACKQCGRNQLLQIDGTCDWSDWLALATARGPVFIAHPDGPPPSEVAGQSPSGRQCPDPLAIAIGPEGGFTPSEIDAALTAGAQLLGLGPQVLRIETAAIAALAALRLAAPKT